LVQVTDSNFFVIAIKNERTDELLMKNISVDLFKQQTGLTLNIKKEEKLQNFSKTSDVYVYHTEIEDQSVSFVHIFIPLKRRTNYFTVELWKKVQ